MGAAKRGPPRTAVAKSRTDSRQAKEVAPLSAVRKALWQQISNLLAKHERAQTDAIREAVADTWESLRTKLQILAIEDESANDGGDPV
jgi:hypothetical protein